MSINQVSRSIEKCEESQGFELKFSEILYKIVIDSLDSCTNIVHIQYHSLIEDSFI